MHSSVRSILIVICCFVPVSGSACADTILWYNGDVFIGLNGTGGGGTVNEETTNRGSLNIYDDFVVTNPAGWKVQRVWSNNSMQTTGVTQASWSIRSGMSAGNGGTVIASGISAATQTSNGRTNPSPGFPEYRIEVTGLDVSLAPGTYWLSVSPLVGIDNGGVFKSYVSTTRKANAIGLPGRNNSNSFINSGFLSYNFANAFSNDYSMGVAGVSVPEPSTVAFLTIGSVVALLWKSKRFRSSGAAVNSESDSRI
jgi:hypothetical protein